jgi:hypothetical protein
MEMTFRGLVSTSSIANALARSNDHAAGVAAASVAAVSAAGASTMRRHDRNHDWRRPRPAELSLTTVVSTKPLKAVAASAEDALHLPVVTEEEWQHREEQRQKAVKIGKATTEYAWYKDQKREDEPATPDYMDRSLSRKKWKYCLLQWRTGISQRYMEENLCSSSVVSTEAGQTTSMCGEPLDEEESLSTSGSSLKAFSC